MANPTISPTSHNIQRLPDPDSLFVGVDIAKDHLVCSLVDTACKQSIWCATYSNDATGVDLLLKQLPAGVPISLEPTGRYGDMLIDAATHNDRRVYLAPGRRARAYNRSIQSRAKTDPIDSCGLALFAASHSLRLYRLKSEVVDRIDQHLSFRKALSQTIARLSLQAQSMPLVSESIVATIDQLRKQLHELDKTIQELVSANPEFADLVGRLRAIPGVGPVTATAVASRLIHKQFTHPDQFVAYIGMDIVIVQSGKRKGQLGLSKDGDGELRRLLYCAAQSSLRCKYDTTFCRQFEREKAKGHSSVQAICAIARKMAKVCWSLQHHKSAYDPHRVFVQPHTPPVGAPQAPN
jgi:transposase